MSGNSPRSRARRGRPAGLALGAVGLAAAGDTTRALRMLRGAAALLRARIHAAREDTARAAHHYGTVLRAYEIPAPRLAGALEEARAFVREHGASHP